MIVFRGTMERAVQQAQRAGYAARQQEVDLLRGEIEHLRGQNDALLEQVVALAAVRGEVATRVERARAGLPEIAPDSVERVKPRPMSRELRAFIEAYQSPMSREAAAQEATRMLRAMPSDEVLAYLVQQQEGGDDGGGQ
jgi:hypothetical protein